MLHLDAYSDDAICRIVEEEGWDQPLVPVERIRPSGWYTAAFWILRLYVGAMLAVVTYAFVHGSH